ncbi:uncharacterized protein HMPREF1541_03123 [Cyphellophora europaea CBS 101466]|uniref:VWFA domain-containing protein n=1 Tax=Cyphellophora europaea (strain CBS 101466) TaxID=1220924 RepID=W2RZH4_CYPE1|nr:uncharacterized protein HMPREF1541_03123 [Cyphellophora europaea CBS 101466]ETN41188.1 hypothetical protein HMPREF1541_03123 [Cyphellophora europaea CBS 101466]
MTVKIKKELNSSICSGLNMPIRMAEASQDRLTTYCSPVPGQKAATLSLQPPRQPEGILKRAPCDIVLVIDVSASMSSAAPLPDLDGSNSESAGLSILDLVKHAARTILETLDKGDRLALVTFSKDANVIHKLTTTTGHNKRRLQKCIEDLVDEGCTNLWAGIRAGLEVFEDAGPSGNVQGMYVLTDGQPNHMCPAQGYVPKMKPLLANLAAVNGHVPTIHTFGFGYDIRSGLLQSIAEVGLGSYAFIPDAGMIGTVFIHAVANLFTTFATQTVLEINSSSPEQVRCATVFNSSIQGNNTTVLRLGNLHYGQSRDLVVQLPDDVNANDVVLRYVDSLGDEHAAPINFIQGRNEFDLDYHSYRSELCFILAQFFPRLKNDEHQAIGQDRKEFTTARVALEALTVRMRDSALISADIQSLLDDIDGDGSAGQISKALLSEAKTEYWQRWGKHYLPSVLHAHARQVCNSFKDPGPLRYGHASPLFIHCRDQLDIAFDKLPAPKPSRLDYTRGPIVNNISMSRYHNSDNSCFDGDCKIRLADDSYVAVASLRAGIEVWTPNGGRSVVAVLKSIPRGQKGWLVRVGDLWVTPWHPIFIDGNWVFPLQVANGMQPCTRAVYSVLLEPSHHVDSHAVEVSGQICVSLGHGILQDRTGKDIRAHKFFGNHKAINRSLSRLPRDSWGCFVASGVRRDPHTRLIVDFMSPKGRHKMTRFHMRSTKRALANTILD